MDLVTIAKLAKTRGLRGELVGDVLTDFPERFEGLEGVTAVLPDGKRRELKIERFWFQKGRIVLKFAGLDTIESAEPLRGAEICVSEDDAVDLEDDEFFDWQLEDVVVETIDGLRIGKVKEIMRTGGTDILVVSGESKEYLIPFAEKICVEVDIDNKLIKIDPPEGLLEF